ncbi:MAG: flagellar basal body rod protein FlgB [bacterium]|nr:flagellar basal body rod protein FlgB [bacterium]
MLKTGIFEQSHLGTLKKALDVYAKRHQVTAENIANVETGGYRSRAVRFEDMLTGAGRSIQGLQTHENHIPIGGRGPGDVEEEVVAAESGFDNGINDVDIDTEMTDLATNDLSYRMATRLLSMRYGMLRSAIKGRSM